MEDYGMIPFGGIIPDDFSYGFPIQETPAPKVIPPSHAIHLNEANSVVGTILDVSITLIIAVLMIVAMWRIFKKAGKPGWFALIPVFNVYELFAISWRKSVGLATLITMISGAFISVCGIITFVLGFGDSKIIQYMEELELEDILTQYGEIPTTALIGLLIVLFGFFVSFIGMMFVHIAYAKTAQVFGKGVGFQILTFLFPCVGLMIVAFGKNKYSKYGAFFNGVFEADTKDIKHFAEMDIQNVESKEDVFETRPQYCRYCGGSLAETDLFCGGCGRQVSGIKVNMSANPETLDTYIEVPESEEIEDNSIDGCQQFWANKQAEEALAEVKVTGNQTVPSDLALCKEYWQGGKTQQEICDKYGITKGSLKYKLRKYKDQKPEE